MLEPWASSPLGQKYAAEVAAYERAVEMAVWEAKHTYGVPAAVAAERFIRYAQSRPEPVTGAYHRLVAGMPDAVRAIQGLD